MHVDLSKTQPNTILENRYLACPNPSGKLTLENKIDKIDSVNS